MENDVKHEGPRAWWPLPEVGSVWRERRKEYHRRTVRVRAADEGFIHIETITTDRGVAPLNPVRTRVRRTLWHAAFVRVTHD